MDIPTILSIIQFIGAIALLIIIHEMGHFLVSKLLNVEVEEFGLGFPPRMVKLFEWGGTIFSLNWLPLGGFVRPKGENDPEVEGGLAAASPWVRLAVLSAGPAANLLAGALIYAFIFLRMGAPILDTVEIMAVANNSPAAVAGLQSGDIVLEVNGGDIDSTHALRDVIYANLDRNIQITYLRGDLTETASLVPRSEPPEGEGAIGIVMGNPIVDVNPAKAILLGGSAVYQQGRMLLSLPANMLRGNISPEDGRVVGYKGMYDIYSNLREYDAASETPAAVNTLGFFGSITVSLALLNLLPIPALDGGRILFTLPEIVIRRRIPQAYENMINLVGLAMLMVLLIYINVRDFTDPVILP